MTLLYIFINSLSSIGGLHCLLLISANLLYITLSSNPLPCILQPLRYNVSLRVPWGIMLSLPAEALGDLWLAQISLHTISLATQILSKLKSSTHVYLLPLGCMDGGSTI